MLDINHSEIQNNKGLIMLSPLLDEIGYLPFTDSSLNFSSLAIVINDIIINNRKIIVEFGSGISTIVLANLFKINKVGEKIISVEHDLDWFNFMKKYIIDNDLSNYVDLVYAELEEIDFSINGCKWYSFETLKTKLSNYGKIDCVLVDGPPAWEKGKEYSRFPALPFLKNYMNDNSSIFLDDTNRNAEKEIANIWLKDDLESFSLEVFNESFTGLFKGKYFNIRLPKVKFNEF